MTFCENNESIAIRVHIVTIFTRDHSMKFNIILRFLALLKILMCMWINFGEGVEDQAKNMR
jgi:hypothetical protein